ncbi:hypothetical protein ISN45_Aa06g032950 [Arabidopsis thaliana x Arabidopsis arenosa]|uniref:Ribosome maturation factor n=1 Tax=Arabidopsis thaliana x Arabidopsis arenosa TaxID=1240361 RepID=A0A8T1Z2Q4_9BRAS|nr:hypothetical protein ISN45_Aa06g032950 [Arabidopsis thaliana x Arabidopsis arenosa]KAG7552706.1 hypothetical protein ISN45_Aa06g032950 [Arabidopsis thaliana x Arabidopsis arenosa]
MATENPITTETVALTEKKMDMSLDEIIKMEKSNTNVNKGKKQRASNKKEKFNGAAKNSAVKAQRYMDSRSDVRQGAFAKRRSNFQGNGNQFPVTATVARKAASAIQLRGRPYNAGRMTNTNQSRFITPPAQNRAAQRGFVAKTQQQQQREKIKQKQANGGGGGQRQWPQTLDSRFANMKEERMRMRRFADNRSSVGNNGAGLQQQQRSMVPWVRRATRFPN